MADTSTTGKHFTAADDVLLLKEASSHRPWSAPKVMVAWGRVAARLRKSASFPQDKDGKALRTRFYLLTRKHQAKTLGSMRKSGREEDVLEREKLLDEIAATYDAEAKADDSESEPMEHATDEAVVPRAASGNLDQSTGGDSSESDVPPKKKMKKVSGMIQQHTAEHGDASHMDRLLDLLHRQLDQQQQQLTQQSEHVQQLMQMQQEQMRMQQEQTRRHQEQTQAFLGLLDKLMHK